MVFMSAMLGLHAWGGCEILTRHLVLNEEHRGELGENPRLCPQL